MILRLHELPRGYLIGDDSSCGPFGTEGAPERLAKFVTQYRPEGCHFKYERLYRFTGGGPDPPLVSGIAITTPSVPAAQAGIGVAPELLSYLTGDERFIAAGKSPNLGDEGQLFHTNDALVQGRSRRHGSVALWRYGSVLTGVYVAGQPLSSDDRIASQLAPRQQAHVETPTPYTEAEQDDTLVPLDNPALPVPVYWLGRVFRPANGLPSSSLAVAWLRPGPPGEKLRIEYSRGLYLDSWTRSSWNRFRGTKVGGMVSSWHCTRSKVVKLRRGKAVIFSGYGKDFAHCPDRPPDRYLARAQIGHIVVGVNLPLCELCGGPGSGAYNSEKGMETVVRSLRIRQGN